MSTIDTKYIDLCRDILANGSEKGDRTGTGTISVFGRTLRHDLSESFPILTTKSVHFKSVVGELLFFLSGETNTRFLEDNKVKIWREWQDVNGNLGAIYSHQWRNAGGKHKNRVQPVPEMKPTKGGFNKGVCSIDDKLYSTWSGMISRCYNKDKDNYSYYGGKGVYVCERWLEVENFISDAKCIEGWDKKENYWTGYQLDKDTLGDGFCYSPQTCIWITKSENMQARCNKVYHIVDEAGNKEVITNPTAFRAIHGIAQGNFDSMLRGNRPKAGGWSLEKVVDLDDGFDQISNLIQEIKTNPSSRRLIVNSWNVSDIEHMALPPCHYSFQCYVDEGRLSLLVNQRSADLFLGVPFNLASYALLCHMLAQVCGLEVGELIWSGADVHIYKNHIEQVKTQIERYDNGEVFEAPTLVLNKDITDIDDFTFDDIWLLNYKNAGKLTGEVAI